MTTMSIWSLFSNCDPDLSSYAGIEVSSPREEGTDSTDLLALIIAENTEDCPSLATQLEIQGFDSEAQQLSFTATTIDLDTSEGILYDLNVNYRVTIFEEVNDYTVGFSAKICGIEQVIVPENKTVLSF